MNTQNQQDKIIKYYDQTRFDYNVAWINKDNLAIHFGFYDDKVRTHKEALVNTNKTLAKLAGIKEGQRILDAGCGKGGSSFWLAKNYAVEVVGISPVSSQIEDCRMFAKEKGLDQHTSFFVEDYCNTSFSSQSFDVVWACESVCHAEQKEAFYKEAFRLLRPGGVVILAEYVRHRRPLGEKKEQLLRSWLNRWAIPDIDTPNEHREHALSAGFSTIFIHDYTLFSWISLKNLHKISKRWIGIGHFLRLIGIRSKIQHANHVGSIRQFQALNQGLWYYAVLKAQKSA